MLASSSECQLPMITYLAVPALLLSAVPVILYSACLRCSSISTGTFLSAMAFLNGFSNPPIGATNTFEPAGIFVWAGGSVWACGCCERADSPYPVANNKSTPSNFQYFISVLHPLSARFSRLLAGAISLPSSPSDASRTPPPRFVFPCKNSPCGRRNRKPLHCSLDPRP